MTYLDVPALLQPLDPASPCGPDLEYSPLYLDASRALEGSPEVQYGSMHVAAVEPDWKRLKAATLELLADTRDLRLAVWLTRALVALHGAAAVADGLALIEGLLARYWEALHPQLDADDDNDPIARINTLLSLDDKAGFVRVFRSAPLVMSERHGRVCLGDIECAANEREPSGTMLEPAAIDAAFADAALDDIAALDAALANALTSLGRIDALLNERAGQGNWASLPALEQVLQRAHRAVSAQRARHPASIECDADRSDTAGASPADGRAAPDRIANRDDVVRMLDRLCAYFAAAEPSSPVPMLLQRARKLVGMDFIDLVADLTPAGVGEAKHWAGSRES